MNNTGLSFFASAWIIGLISAITLGLQLPGYIGTFSAIILYVAVTAMIGMALLPQIPDNQESEEM